MVTCTKLFWTLANNRIHEDLPQAGWPRRGLVVPAREDVPHFQGQREIWDVDE